MTIVEWNTKLNHHRTSALLGRCRSPILLLVIIILLTKEARVALVNGTLNECVMCFISLLTDSIK